MGSPQILFALLAHFFLLLFLLSLLFVLSDPQFCVFPTRFLCDLIIIEPFILLLLYFYLPDTYLFLTFLTCTLVLARDL